MKDFCEKLNASHWKGVISEVGIGMEFCSEYLRHPGASNTIIGIHCDYARTKKPHAFRAVSEDFAKWEAFNNLGESNDSLFGLSITGAHYTDKPSHAWVVLRTHSWEAYIHVNILENLSREETGIILRDTIVQFLDTFLLNGDVYALIRYINSTPTISVDSVYGPGCDDAENLLLLTKDNPLVYDNGRFRRVTDYIRQYDTIYPGSFNPPTKRHLIFEDVLYEIAKDHCFKGSLSTEEILHRARMLNLENKPVLITRSPMYVDKYRLLKACGKERVRFLLGADAWNNMIAPHQYPHYKWLANTMPDVEFEVMERPGNEVKENQVSKNLKYIASNREEDHFDHNSTEVREAEDSAAHDYLTEKVSEYILSQKLYKKNLEN